jgi:alkylhydroperoxidase family enzyme
MHKLTNPLRGSFSFQGVFSRSIFKAFAVCLCCFSLQGCLLNFFFAPKTTEAELPGTIELNELKAAYANHCSSCHILIAPRYFDANQPIERFTGRYRAANIISDAEQAQVNAYIRALIAESKR